MWNLGLQIPRSDDPFDVNALDCEVLGDLGMYSYGDGEGDEDVGGLNYVMQQLRGVRNDVRNDQQGYVLGLLYCRVIQQHLAIFVHSFACMGSFAYDPGMNVDGVNGIGRFESLRENRLRLFQYLVELMLRLYLNQVIQMLVKVIYFLLNLSRINSGRK